MPRAHTKLPLSAYSPRLREFLTRGAVERIVIPCETPRQRRALANQLQNFRARCKEESTDDWEALYRCKVEMPRGTNDLVLCPRGSEFDDILSKAQTSSVDPAATLEEDPLDSLPLTPKGE